MCYLEIIVHVPQGMTGANALCRINGDPDFDSLAGIVISLGLIGLAMITIPYIIADDLFYVFRFVHGFTALPVKLHPRR